MITAEQFREYFTNIPKLYPENRDDPHWRKGVEMSECWFRLQVEPHLKQDDIDTFLERHAADFRRRSMWMALGFEFRCWARQKGFYA